MGMPCKEHCSCRRHSKPRKPKAHYDAYRAQWMKDHRKANPRNYASIRLKSAFNITLEDYETLLEKQGNRCAICHSLEAGGKGMFHVDHDHSCCTGKKSCGSCVRGLLCTRCNVGIAMFSDNPKTMAEAIEYIKLYQRVP